MDRVEVCAVADGEAAVFSSRSPDKDTPNEDAAAVICTGERSGVLVVADGMGGLPAGEEASSLAIRTLRESILHSTSSEGSSLRAAILDGFEAANRAVGELGVGAATTLAVVELQDNTIRPYHVGDSMILVVGQRGKIKLQTVAHSPVGYAVEAGFLDEAEAMYHQERHYVSNMLGASDMHITIGSAIELAPRDTILLASDGLFDNLHTEEIIDCIRKGDLQQQAARMAELAQSRMSHPNGDHPSKADDLTFIACRCGV
jgi:serine/threonine protein phosphatase PrpC